MMASVEFCGAEDWFWGAYVVVRWKLKMLVFGSREL